MTKKLSIQDCQQVALDRGGKCLSKTYINSQTKMQWECNKGHKWFAKTNNIRNGQWCKICRLKTINNHRRLGIEKCYLVAQVRS